MRPMVMHLTVAIVCLISIVSLLTSLRSREFIEQDFGLLQVRRVKPLSEPPVHRSEQVVGILALVLGLPQALQNRTLSGFSCSHWEHCILPSHGRGPCLGPPESIVAPLGCGSKGGLGVVQKLLKE